MHSRAVVASGDSGHTTDATLLLTLATIAVAERARAYLDINCAHRHSPERWDDASRQDLDFRYSTPLQRTGLSDQKDQVARQLRDGNMP